VNCSVLSEDGLESGHAAEIRIEAGMFVAIHSVHRHDLFGEALFFIGTGRFRLRVDCELILFLARNLVLVGKRLRR
jgi:hypothetical protein